jgi:1,5-anhydro-D-fructose reductase (1,5-anhydro-D-mannitol-forming)
MSIRLGIIGLGAMGAELLEVATIHPDFTVVLGADIDQAAVEHSRTKYPNVTFSTVPDEVIDSDEIEAVYIATPPKFHADYSIRAMKRGKHVFCEKPLAISIAGGEAMLVATRETGVVNAVNFALADRHAFLEIERAFKAGEIGEVRRVDIRFLFPKWPRDFQVDAAWLNRREQGGFIREVFSHFVYITDRLLGPLNAKRIDIEFPTPGSESRVDALLNAGGIPVTVFGQTAVAAPETYEWYILGNRRSYCLRNWGQLLVSDGGEWSSVELNGERGTEYTRLTSFATAIRGGEQINLADFAAAFRVQKIVESFHSTASASGANA